MDLFLRKRLGQKASLSSVKHEIDDGTGTCEFTRVVAEATKSRSKKRSLVMVRFTEKNAMERLGKRTRQCALRRIS